MKKKPKVKPQFKYSPKWNYVLPQIISELIWMSGGGQRILTKKAMCEWMRWLVYLAVANGIPKKEIVELAEDNGIFLQDEFFKLLEKQFKK